MKMTQEDVLLAAADAIMMRGLCKGWMIGDAPADQPEKAPLCAAGAVNMAVHGTALTPERRWHSQRPMEESIVIRALDVVAEVVGVKDASRVSVWNDYSGRTADEVVEALHTAARRNR